MLPKLTASHPQVMQQVRVAADKIINARAILWRVEKPGKAPSHLFGTMHVSDPRIMAIPAAARTAIEQARTVALEIADISPGAMLKAVGKVPQLMVYMDGSRLDQKLTQAEFKQVSGHADQSGDAGRDGGGRATVDDQHGSRYPIVRATACRQWRDGT